MAIISQRQPMELSKNQHLRDFWRRSIFDFSTLSAKSGHSLIECYGTSTLLRSKMINQKSSGVGPPEPGPVVNGGMSRKRHCSVRK
jgi:hypothetical protein